MSNREEAARWLEDHRDYPINPAITVGQFVDVLTAHLCGGAIRAESAPYADTYFIGATGSPTQETGKVEEAIDALVKGAQYGGVNFPRTALLSAIEADKRHHAWLQTRDACRQLAETLRGRSRVRGLGMIEVPS